MAVCWKLWGRFICFENCFRKCVILVYKDCPYDPFELVILGWCHETEQTNKRNYEPNGSMHFCAMIFRNQFLITKVHVYIVRNGSCHSDCHEFCFDQMTSKSCSTWNCSIFPSTQLGQPTFFQRGPNLSAQPGWKGSTSMASPFRCVIPHYKRYRRWGWKPGIWEMICPPSEGILAWRAFVLLRSRKKSATCFFLKIMHGLP